jgi:phosphinothricin acetyltransferase
VTEIRPATPADATEIARIYNQGIEERTSTFETELREAEDFERRIADREAPPLMVAEEDGKVVGWAGLSPYSGRACYSGIGEASMYIDREARRRRVGMRLGEALGREAARRGYWKIIGLLLADNEQSIAFTQASGARVVGTLRNHARLDGRWRDVVIIEVLLREIPILSDDVTA